MKIFTSRQYSDLFMTYIFYISNNLRELLPTKYRKCISFFFPATKSGIQPKLTKKLYYTDGYMSVMILLSEVLALSMVL